MTYQFIPIFLVKFKFLHHFFIDDTKKWEILINRFSQPLEFKWLFLLGYVYTYIFFDVCIWVTSLERWTSESQHKERRGLSIHTPLRRRQCVDRQTCSCKLCSSLHAHPSDVGGGATEVDRSIFTWRSYSRYIITCSTWIKNFLSIRGRSDKYLVYKWKTKILEKWRFISQHSRL